MLMTGMVQDLLNMIIKLYFGLSYRAVLGFGHMEVNMSTVTLVRDVIPEGLFEMVEKEGGKVEKNIPEFIISPMW